MITAEQIEALHAEADAHGDIAQMAICSVALGNPIPDWIADRIPEAAYEYEQIKGPKWAWALCARLIAETEAEGE